MPISYTVLDSGIVLATVQTELHTRRAETPIERLVQQQVQMLAPALLHYELIAVARKWVYRQLTTVEKAQAALNTLLSYPVTTVVDEVLLRRAYESATEYNRPTAYDAQYLAVTERYQCDFWTADERLFNAVSGRFPSVYWLGDVKLEA
jgi:predicted nucleic acid-binding protein